MKLLLDLQGCQSGGSRNRGIGRYSLALAQAMVRHGGAHEIWLLLNAAFPDTLEPLREAFAGLVPRLHESGSSVKRQTRLSKIGAPHLRKALYFPAIAAIKYNPSIHAMSERLRERGKCPMQIIGAAMRKLIHLAFGVLKSGNPYDPLYSQNA